MTIKTKSVFYYVDGITSENNLMNFIEPTQANVELTAQLLVGTYSMSQLAQEVQRGMNDIGDNVYTVSFDRDTRILTITGDAQFDLLVTSGSNIGKSIWSLIGFTTEKTGQLTYDGDIAFGNEYAPQYAFQDYKGFVNSVEGIKPSINESASGVIEVITFGTRSFMECNIKWITDRTRAKDSFIGSNQSALEEVRDFLDFGITKQNLEFMSDISDRSEFDIVLLESTRKSRNGTGYELKEMMKQNLDEYYETQMMKFRKV
jgi:hypothetical protein